MLSPDILSNSTLFLLFFRFSTPEMHMWNGVCIVGGKGEAQTNERAKRKARNSPTIKPNPVWSKRKPIGILSTPKMNKDLAVFLYGSQSYSLSRFHPPSIRMHTLHIWIWTVYECDNDSTNIQPKIQNYKNNKQQQSNNNTHLKRISNETSFS